LSITVSKNFKLGFETVSTSSSFVLCCGKLPARSHGGESGSGGHEEGGSPERRQRVG